MIANTKKDRELAENLTRSILKGAGFSGFRFDTAFTLKFERSERMEFEGHELPWVFEFQILSKWWFDSDEKWKHIVNSFGDKHHPEPEEPLKAYELTSLRWTEGSIVEQISFDESCLSIVFKNRKSLSVSFESEEDYAWIIKEPNVPEEESLWSVVCENSEFFVRIPYILRQQRSDRLCSGCRGK